MPADLVVVPCLNDNYAYLIHDTATDATAVVDVPEAAPILTALAERGWKLTHILLTHHHDDHIGGVEALVAATGARVVGARADAHRLPPLTEAVTEGDMVQFGTENFEVIDVPGHTVGHIAFHLPHSHMVFTGDSLMSWGCGRLFEGTPAQMWESLQKLAALPEETLICSGHEYTTSNGRFALHLEPDNPALISRFGDVNAARAANTPTVPVPLALERATNPFLRAADPALSRAAGLPDAEPLAVFAALRALKDRF
ncbi:hydroxyacylglutathione hydrolase [Phaeovulum sp. W22_SRMD_FR3]|uniref:hydroxyacylglutathione hydrolase n=1 Tax=Phaeovulum sp. W22_SRMD_FR3 TaxID=3240274 RepID=UPI003F951765